MRIRRKKWAKEELENASFYINNPEVGYKNTWHERFKNNNPIHMEIGCGKGAFISELIKENPNINYIAIDMVEAMLGLSKRNIENALGKNPKNIFLIRLNAERILDAFGKLDTVNRIYINFCNPWPRGKHNKRRLTHPRQLESYKVFLESGAEIHFKTDDLDLFDASRTYFKESGFKEIAITYDLDKEHILDNSIETEHEKMFKEQGIKIKAGIFKL